MNNKTIINFKKIIRKKIQKKKIIKSKKKKNKHKKEMSKIIYLTFFVLLFQISLQTPCSDKNVTTDNKTECQSINATTTNFTCCFIKGTKDSKTTYQCLEVNNTLEEIKKKEESLKDQYDKGTKVEVICESKFISYGLVFAFLLLVL